MAYVMALVIGIFFVIIGIIMICIDLYTQKKYREIKKGKSDDYAETIGKVICNAYAKTYVRTAFGNPKDFKVVTPIVEYYVNGEKYEGQNDKLTTNGEIPEGTGVKVWYKKEKPEECILETQIDITIKCGRYSKKYEVISIILGIIGIAVAVQHFLG